MSDYVVFQQEDEVVAREEYTNDLVIRRPNASEVFEAVMESLARQGGGSVHIASGTYAVEQPIELPSMTSVIGSGRATVLALAATNTHGVIFSVDTGDAIVISDLTCQGSPGQESLAGIVLTECGDCEIRGVTVRDFGQFGILLRRNCFMNKLLYNTTSGNGRAGTFISETGRGRGGDWTPNLVLGCTSIGEKGHGFELSFAICTNLVGCQVYQPAGHGYYFHSESNSTCLSGSRVYQGAQNGVLVQDSHELNVSSNIICWNRGHGMELNHVIWGTVSANNFIDNGARVQPQTNGIYMHTDTNSLQVTANALFNWEGHLPMLNGIYEAEDCHNNQITNNTINYFSEEGVVSRGQNSVAVNNLAVPERYPHPGAVPFPELGEPFTGEPFSPERVTRFLELTRRQP